MKNGPKNSESSPAAVITVDSSRCSGCRACEVACSLHHTGLMSVEASSIKVSRSNQTAAIEWEILSTCDMCDTEEQPLCQSYCDFEAVQVGVPA